MIVSERFREIFESPIPDRVDCRWYGAMSRDNDDWQARLKASQASQYDLAAKARHVHVEQHNGRRIVGGLFERCAPAVALLDFKSGAGKYVPDGPTHIGVVVYDQNF
jgi:hypothetical protein